MISTTHARNGFHHDLLPMALTSSDPASSALRNAMLAISAHHSRGVLAALPYKTSAVGCLSRAIASDLAATETVMAASMMLCVYSVFDEGEGNWHVHLDGARNMLQSLYTKRRRRLDSEFTLTWFLYHEVLGCFTQPSRVDDNEASLLTLAQASVQDATLAQITGSLGCSLETISIIHSINKLRQLNPNPTASSASPEAAKHRLDLDDQLTNLVQTPPPLESPAQQTRILAIAELYRLAAVLYLQRACPMPADGDRRASYLERALSIIAGLEVATSPWPVFVVACESAPSDELRVAVLAVLDRMDEVRGIGNVRVMRGLVETFWKRYDLGGLGEGAWASWWDVSDGAVAEPWFI
ncbi:hypothetical protein AK830_g6221 [Neonectria ditissima]|uniref:Uncharacterized protein n=1 Tax=Neonectria ditissima TaxID=78410 RepID=A0A0P7BH91_9HYPO|nr:hypothetical protein AK830_g6221 [Neonectria ditissima]